MTKKEYNKKWREEHPDYAKKKSKEWKQNHKSEVVAYNKQYREEHKEEQKQRDYERYHSNPEKEKQRRKEYYRANPEKALSTNQKYSKSKSGRATKLILNYKRNDIEYDRGDCTLTKDWVIANIFSSSCIYCGDSDWQHLGADRIDNSLPHTPENCVCACGICNIERQIQDMSVEEFKEYRLANPRKCDTKKGGS